MKLALLLATGLTFCERAEPARFILVNGEACQAERLRIEADLDAAFEVFRALTQPVDLDGGSP